MHRKKLASILVIAAAMGLSLGVGCKKMQADTSKGGGDMKAGDMKEGDMKAADMKAAAAGLGCPAFNKPYIGPALGAWLDEIEPTIPADRKLGEGFRAAQCAE